MVGNLQLVDSCILTLNNKRSGRPARLFLFWHNAEQGCTVKRPTI